MVSIDFNVLQFIGKGCYSMVYEVSPKSDQENQSIYAFKRIFIQEPNAIECAIRERNILVRIAEDTSPPPFLPTLYYSYILKNSPVLVLHRGSGWDLFQLLTRQKLLSEHDARFYASEIICGLEHLHSMQIVHLDLKPENILLDKYGHLIISDFDRSFDLSLNQTPKPTDFGGTLSFMAPEIAKQELLSTKADIWSLAALIAEMVSGPIRSLSRNDEQSRKLARQNQYKIANLNKLSKNLQSLFNTCLASNPNARPDIAGVKGLRFFKFVDWEKVLSFTLQPPFDPSTFGSSPSISDWGVDPFDKFLLDAAFDEHMPLIRGKLELERCRPSGGIRCVPVSPNYEKLKKAGINIEHIQDYLGEFNFVHPSLRKPDSEVPEIVENKEVDEVSTSLDVSQMSVELELVRERHFSRD
nr:ribosomal protein S6 kinase alpha 2 [Hymenolepis microstoma]